MAAFFLIIIYLAFISLGLPDSLLGVTWPVMQSEFGAPLETAGLLFMVIAGGTIVSSLMSGTVIKRFGTGKVAFVSSVMTAAALVGFSFSPSLVWLFLCAIPLGLGAGAIDAGLNNYVAAHYKAHHMNWLHCFWGVGATLGPIVMASFISGNNSWRNGYLAIAGIQLLLVVILFLALPLWDRIAVSPLSKEPEQEKSADGQTVKPFQIKGVKLTLIAFLFYCGAESAIGLWGSSFLVNVKDLSIETAAKWVSLYFAGITVGRFVTGFISLKISNYTLIRTGQAMALGGAILLLLPLPAIFSLVGFVLIGLGLAPIFPSMLHETPTRFGKEHSQTIMGYQMALAYTGSTFLPPLLGFMASQSTIAIFPFVIAIFIAAMFLSSELLNAFLKKKHLLSGQKKKTTVF
ncbi:MFS transporter [Planococcus shixiaomingii]|uniref:MFS transporter n=1 Tax=Planococcus shixiaomingii TaxID=3058393 RepID=UPI002615E1A4|nr:MFS transporter [Planococcus sp. N022]WKA54741.1 MFS transporter [Planococcus sp. N022]